MQRVVLKDAKGMIVDLQAVGYEQLLDYKYADDVESLAKLAGITFPQYLKGDTVASYLSKRVVKILPSLAQRLSQPQRASCESLLSAGGCLPKREVIARLAKQTTSPADTDAHASRSDSGRHSNPSSSLLRVDNEGEPDEESRRKKKTLLDLFVFAQDLYCEDASDRSTSYGTYLLMPIEARHCFPGVAKSVSNFDMHPEEMFLKAPELHEVIGSLLEQISSARSPPKPTPKEGLAPKSAALPVFEKQISSSEIYGELYNAENFDWKDLDEVMMSFSYSQKIIKKGERGLEVLPSNAEKLLSSRKRLNETFLRWWASKEDNKTSIIKSKIYQFEAKIPRIKSDEARARELIYEEIKKMEEGKWYARRSIIERAEKNGGSSLFETYGINIWGPGGVIDGDEFAEFSGTMLTFPLCILGILETNGPGIELLRLGRWSASASVEPREREGGDVVITPDFEVILQPTSRLLAFKFREFCEGPQQKSPALLFKITKSSVIGAFRKRDYDAEKIIDFFKSCGGNLPENVSHELTEWGKRYGELEVKNIEVMECIDDILADALMSDREASKYIARRVGKTTLEIRSGSRSKILSRCDSLGFFAKA